MKRRILSLLLSICILSLLCLSGCAERSTGAVSAAAGSGDGVSASASGESSAGPDTSASDDPSGGIAGGASPTQSEGETNADPSQALIFPEEPEHTQEYGTRSGYLTTMNGVSIRCNYPNGDIPALDDAILQWAEDEATAFGYQLEEGENGALSAGYDSYEVNGRVVSVLVTGTLLRAHDSLPQSVKACFNADRNTGALLTLDDLLRTDGESALRALVAERSGLEADNADLLTYWLLTATGLTLYLPDDTTVELSYEELLGILDLPAAEQVIDPTKPMIALTFDDGPSVNTPAILDLLELYGGKATFFVVGSRVSTYADTIKRCADMGNEIGIHTWGHTTLTGLSTADIQAEVGSTADAVAQYAGFTCAAVRPPGGACNDTVKQVVGDMGYFLCNWSIDTEDWRSRDADAVYEAIMSEVTDGAIILCHDLYSSTAEAMERVIPELVAQGYQLVTVSELLSYSDSGIVPGTLYRHR